MSSQQPTAATYGLYIEQGATAGIHSLLQYGRMQCPLDTRCSPTSLDWR